MAVHESSAVRSLLTVVTQLTAGLILASVSQTQR
jgi:hypothetical protein